jgi:hypothetical protein
MATDDDDRRGEAQPDDRGYLPGIPNVLRNLIGRADALLIQELTPDELERIANAQQSIDRLGKAKKELESKVLARQGTDWRQRLTPMEKRYLDIGHLAEHSLRVSIALRGMHAEEFLEYHELERCIGEAEQIRDELMSVAMDRRGTDED